jgi:hypothetical protein
MLRKPKIPRWDKTPEGGVKKLSNKTANSAFRGTEHRLHLGVLYCQNGTRFHGTHTFPRYARECSFVEPPPPPQQENGPSCDDVHKSPKCSTSLRTQLQYQISLESDKECGKYWQKFSYAPKQSISVTVALHETHVARHFLKNYCNKYHGNLNYSFSR